MVVDLAMNEKHSLKLTPINSRVLLLDRPLLPHKHHRKIQHQAYGFRILRLHQESNGVQARAVLGTAYACILGEQMAGSQGRKRRNLKAHSGF